MKKIEAYRLSNGVLFEGSLEEAEAKQRSLNEWEARKKMIYAVRDFILEEVDQYCNVDLSEGADAIANTIVKNKEQIIKLLS